MIDHFEPPKNTTHCNQFAIGIQFYEGRLPGHNETFCGVLAYEIGIDVNVYSPYRFPSWDEMKQQYPTMRDWLNQLAQDEMWNMCGFDRDCVYYLAEIEGAEHLYGAVNDTIWAHGDDIVKR